MRIGPSIGASGAAVLALLLLACPATAASPEPPAKPPAKPPATKAKPAPDDPVIQPKAAKTPKAGAGADKKRRARLEKGAILMHTRKVKGFGVPRIHTTLMIAAPPAAVWKRIRDCRNLRAIVPALEKVVVKRDTKTHQRCWMEVDTPFPFSDLESELDYTRKARPGHYELSFRLHKGDYVRNRGVWTLTPFDAAGKRTLVRYWLHSIPKTRAPDSAITWGTKRNVRHMLTQLQKLSN